MRLIYAHPNSLIVGAMRNALDELGIETEIRNDTLGGAAGEIAPGETWIELWIVKDEEAPPQCAAFRRLSISLTKMSGTAIIARSPTQQRLSSVGNAKRSGKPKFRFRLVMLYRLLVC